MVIPNFPAGILCAAGDWNGEYYEFGFKKLKHGADEIRGIIKDIHDCLDKHNSTHIDLFFPKEGIVILLSTGEQIDSALFYKSYETVGQDSKGYRQVTYHYNSTDLVTPLQIALDFDYVIHEKTVFKWDMFMDDGGIRDLLKENKNNIKSIKDINEIVCVIVGLDKFITALSKEDKDQFINILTKSKRLELIAKCKGVVPLLSARST